ncbi:MAG: LacI family DNA-binding transcriptional regulator [Oscillospiraceae bacterium]
MSVTIKDVAREAGVSVATVSRVLNGSTNVSESSSKLVRDTIERLNYSPNFLGRNLRKCETNVILVIMPTSDHSLYMKIVAGMQAYAQKVGYDIITAASNSATQHETRQMNMLYNRTVDGVVLLGTLFDAQSLNDLASKYNIALCCEGVEGANVLTVAVDDEQAGYDAVCALIKKGHRKIAFIGTNSVAVSSFKREAGYLRALKDNDIPVEPGYMYKGTYDYWHGGKAMEQFMSLEDKPTAVFAVSDILAMNAIRKACEMGLEVGKDVSVMGFDNISMCEMTNPSVSTVEQPCEKMGELVVQKLIENFSSSHKDNKYYTVPHRIILRESTGD